MSPSHASMKTVRRTESFLKDKDKNHSKCSEMQKIQRDNRREISELKKASNEMKKVTKSDNSILAELVNTIKEGHIVMKDIAARLPMLNPKEV